VESLGETISSIVESIQIELAMEFQDEIDRDSIALVGYKEDGSKSRNRGMG
jgi:hypothetical protein